MHSTDSVRIWPSFFDRDSFVLPRLQRPSGSIVSTRSLIAIGPKDIAIWITFRLSNQIAKSWWPHWLKGVLYRYRATVTYYGLTEDTPVKAPMRKKLSRWAHGDHGGHGSGPNDHGSVTARRGHSSVTARRGHSSGTARSQLSHGEVTAQSRHLQYDHGSVTARSQLNHGPGHGSGLLLILLFFASHHLMT